MKTIRILATFSAIIGTAICFSGGNVNVGCPFLFGGLSVFILCRICS